MSREIRRARPRGARGAERPLTSRNDCGQQSLRLADALTQCGLRRSAVTRAASRLGLSYSCGDPQMKS
eukprot:5368017-Prymnesium_polylepis.2